MGSEAIGGDHRTYRNIYKFPVGGVTFDRGDTSELRPQDQRGQIRALVGWWKPPPSIERAGDRGTYLGSEHRAGGVLLMIARSVVGSLRGMLNRAAPSGNFVR